MTDKILCYPGTQTFYNDGTFEEDLTECVGKDGVMRRTIRVVNPDTVFGLMSTVSRINDVDKYPIEITIPYCSYWRSTTSAKMLLEMMSGLVAHHSCKTFEYCGVRLLLFDPHKSDGMQYFYEHEFSDELSCFNIEHSSISHEEIFKEHMLQLPKKGMCYHIVAPDEGASGRAADCLKQLLDEGYFAQAHGSFIKRRDKMSRITSMSMPLGYEDVELSDSDNEYALELRHIIVDDILDTGGTLMSVAHLLRDKRGATHITAYITHLSTYGPKHEGLYKVMESELIDELVLSNTMCPLDFKIDGPVKVSVVKAIDESDA